MIANSKMKRILRKIKTTSSKIKKNLVLSANVDELIKLINPDFILLSDCVCFRSLLNRYKKYGGVEDFEIEDKAGFEWDNTEVLVNAHFINSRISVYEMVYFTIKLIGIWSYKLKLLCPGARICFIVSCCWYNHAALVTLRFHQVRNDELPFVDKGNIERFDQPVGYIII